MFIVDRVYVRSISDEEAGKNLKLGVNKVIMFTPLLYKRYRCLKHDFMYRYFGDKLIRDKTLMN